MRVRWEWNWWRKGRRRWRDEPWFCDPSCGGSNTPEPPPATPPAPPPPQTPRTPPSVPPPCTGMGCSSSHTARILAMPSSSMIDDICDYDQQHLSHFNHLIQSSSFIVSGAWSSVLIFIDYLVDVCSFGSRMLRVRKRRRLLVHVSLVQMRGWTRALFYILVFSGRDYLRWVP